MSLTLLSPAFSDKGEIPAEYTCEGKDISPPLEWHGLPDNARSLVLIIDDPDAPDPTAPRMTWVHWVVYNIPASATGLPAGANASNLPSGTEQGLNDWKRLGYGGPCPPIGQHRYFHKLYALDTRLQPIAGATKQTIEAAMRGHVIAEAVLMGTYVKAR